MKKKFSLPDKVLSTVNDPATSLFAKTDNVHTEPPVTETHVAKAKKEKSTLETGPPVIPSGYVKQFLLRIPSDIHKEADSLAVRRRTAAGKPMTLSAWIIEAIIEKIKKDTKQN